MDSVLTNACTVKIENFEGPFDLLYHLIEKNKFNIYDIPINEITDQYMDYLHSMDEMDLDIAGEFLLVASTLLHIKSRMLLPAKKRETEENPFDEDPRDALVRQLIQYKIHKEAAGLFKERLMYWGDSVYKEPEPHKVLAKIDELDKDRLISGINRILRIQNEKLSRAARQRMRTILKREKVSLRAKIAQVLSVLKGKASFKFSEIFSLKKTSKPEVVTGFLALLELARGEQVTLRQKKLFDEIYVHKMKKKNNDPGIANIDKIVNEYE